MKQKYILFTALIAIITWLIWAFQAMIFCWFDIQWNIASIGQWGDSFGAINTLFSALGLIAVLYTLSLQQRQILDAQQDSHKQQFERKFFELLKLIREARNEVRYKYSEEYKINFPKSSYITLTGQKAFTAAVTEFSYWHKMESKKIKLSFNDCGILYHKKIHRRYESTFGPFFRLIYTILREIRDDTALNSEEKIFYGNLLRSQLTSFETSLAGINATMKEANDLSELLTEFHMFKYLPNSERRKLLENYYSEEAFSSRDRVS